VVYKIGIIGLGIMGRRMLDMVQRHPGFEAAAAFDPRADDLPIPRAASLEALLDRGDLHAVYIATPPEGHLEAIKQAAARNLAILCEKPLASDIAEARAAVEIIRAAGVPAAVNFPFATAVGATGFLDLIRAGRLGRIDEVRLTMRFATWPRSWQRAATWLGDAKSGGFTREVASHFVFLLHRMFGPGAVTASTATRDTPMTAERRLTATLSFGHQTVVIDGAVDGEIDDHNELSIIGSAGRARLLNWQKLEIDGEPAAQGIRDSLGQLDALADLLAGKPSPLATFEEAAAVVGLIEAMLAGK
jgi:predicted dehydrogenase